MMAVRGRMGSAWAVLNKQFTCCYTLAALAAGLVGADDVKHEKRAEEYRLLRLPSKKKNRAQL